MKKKLKNNQFYLSSHLITELPILFQTEMVQANLEDRKNQTRRTRGLDVPADLVFDKIEYSPGHWPKKDWHFKKKLFDINGQDFYETVADFNCPYGKPGDLLWVKETYLKIPYTCGGQKGFKIAFPDKCSPGVLERLPLKPSIHMPKDASRLWLMVEDIRPEWLQDITMEDAKAEGIEVIKVPNVPQDVVPYKDYLNPNNYYQRPDYSFQSLWISINGSASWNSNPFVWRIKYRILSKTGRPDDETILLNYLQVKEKEAVHV
jgi:hypothetical protein